MWFLKKKEQSVNRYKVGNLEAILRIIHAYLDKGKNDAPIKKVKNGYIHYGTRKIFTDKKVIRTAFIHDFPMYMTPTDLFEVKFKIMKDNPNVKVVFTHEYVPSHINMKSQKMKLIKNDAVAGLRDRRKKKPQEDEIENLTKDTTSINKQYTSAERRYLSLQLFEALKGIEEVTEFSFTITLEGEKEAEVDSAFNQLKDILDDGFIIREPVLQTFQFYANKQIPNRTFADDFIRKNFPSRKMPVSTASKLGMLQSGETGDDSGVVFGVNVNTLTPYLINLKTSSKLASFIIIAMSGKGKSFTVRCLSISALSQGFRVIINDYEGDEYDSYGKVFGATFVDLGGKDGGTFDTVEIGTLTGDENIDKDLFHDAKSTTKQVFDMLMPGKSGMTRGQTNVFDKALYDMYEERGVKEDNRRSWHLSKGLRYLDVYKKVCSYVEDEKTKNKLSEDFIDDAKELKTNLQPYFDEKGSYYHYFNKSISIDKLKNSNLIIYRYGNKGKATSEVDAKEVSIKNFIAGYLDSLLANYSYTQKNGQRTFKFFEEGQRQTSDEEALNQINNVFTGGRKRGIIPFFITNSPNQLFGDNIGAGDKRSAAIKAFTDNISGYILGYMSNLETARNVLKSVGKEDFFFQYQKMHQEMKQNENEHLMFNIYNETSTITRHIMPEELIESPLFRTRRDMGDEETIKLSDEDEAVFSLATRFE